MIRVTVLGTAAARPTPGRNVAGIAVQYDGELILWDCGEGTQRQMMRYGSGFNVRAIFITHLHADHFLGLPGLLRTMGLQGRTDALAVYGPPGSAGVLRDAVGLGNDRVPFPVEVSELSPGDAVEMQGYRVEAFPVVHGITAVGYALREPERLGRFDVARARELGVPEGPAFGELHRGKTVEIPGGGTVTPDQVVGPSRRGRLVVYAGDSRPSGKVVTAARGADLLIHEATFTHDERERARSTGHSTAREAAGVARDAEVARLVLTHISARYADNTEPLRAEAAAVFPGVVVARDGLVVEVGYPEDEAP
jgi:ribonuclease Z